MRLSAFVATAGRLENDQVDTKGLTESRRRRPPGRFRVRRNSSARTWASGRSWPRWRVESTPTHPRRQPTGLIGASHGASTSGGGPEDDLRGKRIETGECRWISGEPLTPRLNEGKRRAKESCQPIHGPVRAISPSRYVSSSYRRLRGVQGSPHGGCGGDRSRHRQHGEGGFPQTCGELSRRSPGAGSSCVSCP